jgi:hypothetical protein
MTTNENGAGVTRRPCSEPSNPGAQRSAAHERRQAMTTANPQALCSIEASDLRIELGAHIDGHERAVLALSSYNGVCGFGTAITAEEARTLRDALDLFIAAKRAGLGAGEERPLYLRIGIFSNNVSTHVLCTVCGQDFKPDCGPCLCLDESPNYVCDECGTLHVPQLLALIHYAASAPHRDAIETLARRWANKPERGWNVCPQCSKEGRSVNLPMAESGGVARTTSETRGSLVANIIAFDCCRLRYDWGAGYQRTILDASPSVWESEAASIEGYARITPA